MDVIQNVTSILTADLLKSSLGSFTTDAVAAPYFMIPLVVLTYISTRNRQNLSDNSINSKNLILLETLTNTTIQYEYAKSLRNIKDTNVAKVLTTLFVRETNPLMLDVLIVAERIGFEVQYIDLTHRYLARQEIAEYLKENGFEAPKLPSSVQLTNTNVIFLNSANFKNEWEYPFDIKERKYIRFWTEKYAYKLVEAMHFEAVFLYTEYCDMQIVVIPYNKRKNDLALMIVLPNTIGSLRSNILNRLEDIQEKILKTKLEFQNVKIDLPIFTMEEKSNITDVLYKMSFGKLYRGNAVLDNFLSNGDPISLDNMQHYVKVDINGTVTHEDEVRNHCPSNNETFINFKVNRPFLFYILDIQTHVPYFSGIKTDFDTTRVIDHSKELENDKSYVNCDCQNI